MLSRDNQWMVCKLTFSMEAFTNHIKTFRPQDENDKLLSYMHQCNTEIPQWNRYYHWWSLMRLWFLFSLFLKTDFRLFMNSGLKVLPKRLKCSIIVWNYGEDVNVLRWNRWRHLLRWHNAFFCTRRQADYHWLRDFLCTDFLHFIDLNAILPHFLRKTFILTQYYAP